MLLIIGLDGATLDLIEPWVADGTLPNIGRLMREGAWGPLAATVPPATFPSWTTFMTGVNPGRHGIFDFTRREPGTYRVRFVNATFRKAPTVWRLLSEAGCRTAVLGLPGTYPPEPINGCMISGFDTPVTMRADRSFVYPPALAEEVEEGGGFPFADFQEFKVGTGWHASALESLLRGIARKGALAEKLLAREAWDCFMILLGESDTVSHHFWAFHDPASPRFDGALCEALGDPIRTVYAALDELVGRLALIAPGARILIASDHGFGGTGDTAVHLNRWLAAEGYLAWAGSGVPARLAAYVRRAAVRSIPPRWQADMFRMAGGVLAGAVESRVRFGGIDWNRTRAFSEELNYFPSVWLNIEGRDPNGRVAARDYDRVREALIERLLQWRDPWHGTAVVRRVWHRSELYDGPHVDLAPDLILDLETPGGYSYVCLPSGRAGPCMARLPRASMSGGKLDGMSGSHRENGVVILAGPGIERGPLRGAAIADAAPTVLSLCGVAVPDGWDGRTLPCVSGSRVDICVRAVNEKDETCYEPHDEETIRQRLVDLGYLA